MKIVRIPKRNGKFRTIYMPDADEKAALAWRLPAIAAAAAQSDLHGVQHGFTFHRSPVTNASAHTGRRYTLCFDLQDFFDTVTPELVGRAGCWANLSLADSPIRRLADSICFPDGAARQGLPTSPSLANLAAAPMDAEIMQLQCKGRFVNFVYTRYADDLTFSFDHPDVGDLLRREVPRIVERHGFRINLEKTRWQTAAAGRRHITGLAVDERLHMPRALKRRIRAAEHQSRAGLRRRHLRRLIARQQQEKRHGRTRSLYGLHQAQWSGLVEWSRLRPPAATAPVKPATSQTPARAQRPETGCQSPSRHWPAFRKLA